MTNLYSVVTNSIWIVGLAIILAAVSTHYWLAGMNNRPMAQELGSPPFQASFYLGLFMVSLGLAFTGQSWWQKIPAVALSLGCVAAMLSLRRRFHSRHSQGNNQDNDS